MVFINYNCGELGYVLARKYWGNGYMCEAANKVLEYMFTECNFDIITARHLSLNPKSGRVMQKLGMTNEGSLRIRLTDKDGIRNDVVNYSITKEEYLNKIKNQK